MCESASKLNSFRQNSGDESDLLTLKGELGRCQADQVHWAITAHLVPQLSQAERAAWWLNIGKGLRDNDQVIVAVAPRLPSSTRAEEKYMVHPNLVPESLCETS